MTKTHEEIKKGLEHCINGTSCRGRPYCEECATASDCNPMHKDLQEYVQQLEEFADKKIVELFEKVEQLQAERDAAVAGLKSNCTCPECKYFSDDIQEPCRGCKPTDSKFEWRGIQKD